MFEILFLCLSAGMSILTTDLCCSAVRLMIAEWKSAPSGKDQACLAIVYVPLVLASGGGGVLFGYMAVTGALML